MMLKLSLLLAHLDNNHLTSIIADYQPSLGAMLTGLAIAVGLGALHALSPGHGKTLVSAYLIGNQGTALHAIILGLTTSLTHTIGVFALGLIALFFAQYLLPEQLYPILSIVSGLTVLGVGIRLLQRRLKSQPEHHHHHHDHAHSPSDAHPITLSSLVALGIAGGLVPCPSALVMLLAAIALHHTVYGLLLTAGFSIGLALVLVILGLIAVYARQWLENLSVSTLWFQRIPLISAIFVVCVGISLTLFAVRQL